MFKPGKNCDRYFDTKELLAQVNPTIDIFESKTNGLAQGLFMFNNAPSHMKHAVDAISATKMVKSASYFTFLYVFIFLSTSPKDPKHLWAHHPNGPCMHDSINPLTEAPQSFYFPDDHLHHLGWFKGMEQIICECGLWPKHRLPAKCTGPKCPEGQVRYCCCHLLYTQPDFMLQRPMLQEHIELCGHLYDYYPKYYCKLNFIEQYWGAAKLQFHVAGHARTLEEMQRKMLESLDNIPLEQIQRCIVTPFLFQNSNIFIGLQTGWRASFLPIAKACLVPKQHGPTRNTMAIASCPLI